MRTFIVVLAAIVFLTPGGSLAQVPSAEDIKSCNEKAKLETETASASPRTDTDRPVIAEVKGGATVRPENPDIKKPVDTRATEADPQLQGIDPEGEKDPLYIAAYKKCMRQSGF